MLCGHIVYLSDDTDIVDSIQNIFSYLAIQSSIADIVAFGMVLHSDHAAFQESLVYLDMCIVYCPYVIAFVWNGGGV